MSVIFSSEGYFCEGEADKNWQFSMESGKILLTNEELSLLKKSNINLTEIGSSVDNYNEGFKIPLKNIKKVYPLKQGKIFVVKIETRDDHLFSITLADYQSIGKNKSYELSDIINTTILSEISAKSTITNSDDGTIKYSSEGLCKYCGAKIVPNANFCKNCGMQL